MSGTRWAVLCADGSEGHARPLMYNPSQQGAWFRVKHLDAQLDCGPHRVVERLTDPEPWILGAVRALDRWDAIGNVDGLILALRAVPEVWREAARGAQTCARSASQPRSLRPQQQGRQRSERGTTNDLGQQNVSRGAVEAVKKDNAVPAPSDSIEGNE